MDDLKTAVKALLEEVPDAANEWQATGVVAVSIPAITRLRKAVEG